MLKEEMKNKVTQITSFFLLQSALSDLEVTQTLRVKVNLQLFLNRNSVLNKHFRSSGNKNVPFCSNLSIRFSVRKEKGHRDMFSEAAETLCGCVCVFGCTLLSSCLRSVHCSA